MSKTTIVLSAAITVFTLLILSGIAYSVNQTRQAAAAGGPPEMDENLQTPGSLTPENEAAYQELIRQANERLSEAQAEIQRLQALAGQTHPPEVPAGAPAGISLEDAAQVASTYLGQTEIYSAEESQFSGGLAYRVTFSSGDVVLVSPTGEVLDYRPAAQTSYASQVDDDDREEHDEDEEGHEDHEDHEDEDEEYED